MPTIGEISGGVHLLLRELDSVKSANVGLKADLAGLVEKVNSLSEEARSRHEYATSPESLDAVLKGNVDALNTALSKLTVWSVNAGVCSRLTHSDFKLAQASQPSEPQERTKPLCSLQGIS